MIFLGDERTDEILRDIINRVRTMRGGPGIRLVNGPTGITISLEPSQPQPAAQQSRQEILTVKITGNEDGDCIYTGKSFQDVSADIDPTADLDESMLGTLSASDDCIVLALPELGLSTTGHDITAAANASAFSVYCTGKVAHLQADGKKVIHATEFYAGCSE